MEQTEFQSNKKSIFPSKNKVLLFIILVFLIYTFITGLFTIDPEEVGVIQTFGKYSRTVEPGLHFKIPYGIEQLTKVKVKHVFKEEFGFRTSKAGVNTQYARGNFSDESEMLTGDLNIADVQWIVQYRINDPVKYLFNIRNIEETLRDISESVMRLIVGDNSVDEVIVLSRKDIAFRAQKEIQKSLEDYNAGIEIVTVNLQNVNPPAPVQPAFNDVNSAKQEQEKIKNEALQLYNEQIPKARGKAKQILEEAEGYALKRINEAQGDATRFISFWNEYKKAKKVTRDRLYIETMKEVLPELDNVYIVDEDLKGILPLLNLQKGAK